MSGALCSDGSEDVTGSSITNFNFISGGKDYFIEQTHDGGVTHDAEFVAAEWERVKNTLEPQGYVIVGGIWDNTPVNKAAFTSSIYNKELNSIYKHIVI